MELETLAFTDFYTVRTQGVFIYNLYKYIIIVGTTIDWRYINLLRKEYYAI